WERNKAIGLINILNPDGTLNDAAGKYKGLRIMQSREKVVADLDALGLVGDIEDREIELPHSDRSKTPIEPYLADQWFVKMDQLAQSAMDAVTDGRVKIFPERYAKSYLDWLGEKRDWPVSRQLWWGHRIPVWTKHFQSLEESNFSILDNQNLYSFVSYVEHAHYWFVADTDPAQLFASEPPSSGGFTAYFCSRTDQQDELSRGVVRDGYI